MLINKTREPGATCKLFGLRPAAVIVTVFAPLEGDGGAGELPQALIPARTQAPAAKDAARYRLHYRLPVYTPVCREGPPDNTHLPECVRLRVAQSISYAARWMGSLRSGLLARLVVVCLLLWAAGDLAFPWLCAEDTGAAMQSASGPSSDSAPQKDDCFCCCYHVVPSSNDFPMVVTAVIDAPETPKARPSIGVPRVLFRPPLSA